MPKRFGIAAAVAIASTFTSVAVPPRPTPYTFTNSAGEKIEVLISGSARAHTYRLASDGTPLVRVGDRFFLPEAGADGSVTASRFEASPVMSAEAEAYLASLDRSAVASTLIKEAAAHAAVNAGSRAYAESKSLFPALGSPRGLVIIVEYADVKLRIENPVEHFDRMINEEGYSGGTAPGSIRDYFVASSAGRFNPVFDVYGPVTLSRERAYYGGNDAWGNDRNAGLMASEACRLLDGEIDFTRYDYDNDGYVDNVYVIFAGENEADGAAAETVWPHCYQLDYAGVPESERTFDGKIVNLYNCSSEWMLDYRGLTDGQPDNINTFIHEFSHALGLPDLYSTVATDETTPLTWSVMDVGCYSEVPPLHSAYERYALGWADPVELTGACSVEMLPMRLSSQSLRISTASPDEYFILETRDQAGWDASLPGKGLLIWHIDYDPYVWDYNSVNNNPAHQHVDLIRADNRKNEMSLRTDAFPGTADRYTTFTPKSWSGKEINLPLSGIRRTGEGNNSIAFDVAGGGEPLKWSTGIDGVVVDNADGQTELYDLRGVRVDPMTAAPGMYIRRAADGRTEKVIKR
ncbi:MAG: M6 family metalloprotease domain-containing protein [Candidatus Amulumruptor sp.]|nr:M6 family metalloprotease domain-containing protein [Candidatus Amulumruptor sp.]